MNRLFKKSFGAILFFVAINAQAQQDKVKPIGINVEGYVYAYPIHYLNLKIQGETFKNIYA